MLHPGYSRGGGKGEKGGTYYSQAKKYCKDKTSSPLEPMAQMENGTNGERT